MTFDNYPLIPISQLTKLHQDLTNLEVLVQVSGGGLSGPGVLDKIDAIYEVQEMIEEIVSEEKRRLKDLSSNP